MKRVDGGWLSRSPFDRLGLNWNRHHRAFHYGIHRRRLDRHLLATQQRNEKAKGSQGESDSRSAGHTQLFSIYTAQGVELS